MEGKDAFSSVVSTALGATVQVYRDSTGLLQSGLERYFNQPQFSDVTVVVPGGKRLRCHQLVLSACSRKFADLLEKGDFKGQELPVQGVSADSLELLLSFFYTGMCAITVSTAVHLYDGALKLEVPGLANACEQFIQQMLHPLTAIIFLEQSMQLKPGIEALQYGLCAYIRNRFDDVVHAETFTACSYPTLLKVLLDNKAMQSESRLLKAVSKWLSADTTRLKVAPEILRALNLSESGVQTVLPAALQLGSATLSMELTSSNLQELVAKSQSPMSQAPAAAVSGAPASSIGGPSGLQISALQNVQLLQNGSGVMSLPTVTLQLPNGMPLQLTPAGQNGGNNDLSHGNLLTLLGAQLQVDGASLTPATLDSLQSMLAASAAGDASGLGKSDHGLPAMSPRRSLAGLSNTSLISPTGGLSSLVAAAAASAAANEAGRGLDADGHGSMQHGGRGIGLSGALGGGRAGRSSAAGLPSPSGTPLELRRHNNQLDSGPPRQKQRRTPATTPAVSGAALGNARVGNGGHGSDFGQLPAPVTRLQSPREGEDGKPLLIEAMQLYGQTADDAHAKNQQPPTLLPPAPNLKGVCHVDNCFADLSQLRDYHQRFKICDYHLKVSSIMKDGLPQRFCQQCGRFHLLSEFDGNKRSCRARLQRHNARRRKRPEAENTTSPTHRPASIIREMGIGNVDFGSAGSLTRSLLSLAGAQALQSPYGTIHLTPAALAAASLPVEVTRVMKPAKQRNAVQGSSTGPSDYNTSDDGALLRYQNSSPQPGSSGDGGFDPDTEMVDASAMARRRSSGQMMLSLADVVAAACRRSMDAGQSNAHSDGQGGGDGSMKLDVDAILRDVQQQMRNGQAAAAEEQRQQAAEHAMLQVHLQEQLQPQLQGVAQVQQEQEPQGGRLQEHQNMQQDMEAVAPQQDGAVGGADMAYGQVDGDGKADSAAGSLATQSVGPQGTEAQ